MTLICQTSIISTGTETLTNTQVSQPDENLDYLLKMQSVTDKLQVLNEEFGDEITQFQNNQNLFYDQNWRSQVNSTLEKILQTSNELKSIEPVPQQYVRYDGYLDQAASEYILMVSNVRRYLDGDYDDPTYLLRALENINRSNTYIELAAEELKNINNP